MTSYLSETMKDAHVSPDALSDMIRRIGMDRNSIVHFMKSMMSEGIISATLGHNSMEEYLPQV